MRKTDNFELNLLDAEDFVNKEDLNENAKKIDAKLKEHDTPEYDIYKQKEVEELEAGESLITAIRKLAKAVKTLIEHLANKKNPHEVSAEDVGLGEVTNESKQKMFTTPVFEGTANDKDGYGFGDTCTSPTKIYRHEIEGDVTDNVETEKTVVVGINAGLHLDGNLEAANFKGLAANFTTENWNMAAAAPLVKQLYEENQSLKEQLSTLNSNSSGIKKQLDSGDSAYIYINDGNWYGGIVLISIWRETSDIRGIYMAQPGNGNNTNSYQTATVMALKDNTNITVEAAVDSKYSSVKITNNHTSEVFVRAVALCGSQPEWIL